MLANQAAVALHNSFLFHATTQLRGRSDQLYDATTQHARDLAARSAELAETQRQLVAAMQRQALDDERHRIARELHDSVTQSVLSVGMTIEACRAELEGMGGPAGEVAERLAPAKDLTGMLPSSCAPRSTRCTGLPTSQPVRCPSCCSGCPQCTSPPTCT